MHKLAVSGRTGRSRFLPLTVIALMLALVVSISIARPASAHAATYSLSPQQISMTINGRMYMTAPGVAVRLPTTYPDGSKGWIDFTAGTTGATGSARLTANSVSPNTVSCKTAYGTQTWRNGLNQILISYTLSQYWCYDGTNIVSYDYPGDNYQTHYGWSLANQAVAITQYPTPQWARSAGTFRFNGPFGIGCKSGENTIYWYGTGLQSNQYNTNSYYGC